MTENAFQKKTHHFRSTLHWAILCWNILRERPIRSVIQIEKSVDVVKCKRAVFWLTDDPICGDHLLMPSLIATYVTSVVYL